MDARDYQPGETVPGTVYRIVRPIGAGGMGTVYDVEDITIGKRYVLKTLHPQLGARDDLARRMKQEARTLARLHHPNIVEVITAGVTADDLRLPYYVMERLNGQSLRVVLAKRGCLELPHVFGIGIDLLDALDHAHDKGVIHRDVKPDNIFLHRTAGGTTVTKLLDFGIVAMLDDGQGETAGRFIGTLRYAAPEQLRGERPTAKTDVYAAGLVLFETLAGRGPFDDEGDPHHIGAAHLHRPAPPLSRYAKVPPELDALISAALSKLPEDRPRDAFAFAASLRNLKRRERSAGAAHAEQTDSRPTAPAVLGVLSAREHDVQRAAAGAYVIAPQSPVTDGTLAAKSTLRVMDPPTESATTSGAPAGTTEGVTLAHAPTEAEDPAPPTHTLADTGRAGEPASTEAYFSARSPFAGDVSHASPAPHDFAPSGAFVPDSFEAGLVPEWPSPRARAQSEEPQVRSIATPRARRSAWSVGTAAALVGVAMGASTVALVVMRSSAARAPAAAGVAGGSSQLGLGSTWVEPAPRAGEGIPKASAPMAPASDAPPPGGAVAAPPALSDTARADSSPGTPARTDGADHGVRHPSPPATGAAGAEPVNAAGATRVPTRAAPRPGVSVAATSSGGTTTSKRAAPADRPSLGF